MLTVVSDFSWGEVDEDEGGFEFLFFLAFSVFATKHLQVLDLEISITPKG